MPTPPRTPDPTVAIPAEDASTLRAVVAPLRGVLAAVAKPDTAFYRRDCHCAANITRTVKRALESIRLGLELSAEGTAAPCRRQTRPPHPETGPPEPTNSRDDPTAA